MKDITKIMEQSLNLALQQPGSPPSKNGDITKTGAGELKAALEFPKIKDAPLTDLQAILRRSMILVGLRASNHPNAEETAVLLKFIYSRFGLLTIAEIQLAFEKAVAGELETEANCYENFSCEYFGRIMTAYKKWASEKFSSEQMHVAPVPEPSDEEKQNILRGLIEEQYQKGDFSGTFAMFNQLAQDGYLTEAALKKNAWQAVQTMREKYPTLENEIKGEVAGMYLEWCRREGKENIYAKR